MNTVKHDRFIKIVEKRMDVLINDFWKLGNCASKVSYEYTDTEIDQIFLELNHQIELLRDRFNGKKSFTLTPSDN